MVTPQPGNSKSDPAHGSNEDDRTLPPKHPSAGSPATVVPVQDAVATLPPQSPSSAATVPVVICIGATLGPYELLDKLGEGGMGAVYKARHQHLDKMVAVKVLSQQFTSHADSVARFKREMKAVGKLTHANIVQAFDAGEIGGTHYLAMELVEGTDLQKLVKDQGPLSPANACRAVRQAAIALTAAHAAGLVHRDIKPSNLLVAKNGQIKLLDLGLARLAGDAGKATDLTAAGQAFGTPDYMAPEQWEDAREADARADLYALGCTLFFLLTGHAPFEDDKHQSTVSKMSAHVLDAVPDLQAARGDIPDGISAIYQRLVAKQPENRFQTATELAEALHPYASGKTTGPVAEAPGASGAGTLRGDKLRGSGDAVAPADLAARARSAKELVELHCYQEAIVLLEEVPGAENIPGMRDILFEARQRQFEVSNLLGTIQLQMRRKDRASRQQLRTALERLRVLKPQHKEFEAQLAQLERAEHGRLHIPLPGLKQPLDIPWAAAIPALIVGGLMLAMGVWVIVRDKDGKEVARVPVPQGGSATVTTGDPPSANDKPDNSDWRGWPADVPPPAIAPFDAAQAKQHQEAWAKHLGLPVEYTNTIGMKFVLIPPGEFMMGSTAGEIENALKEIGEDDKYGRESINSEAPQHKVTLTQPIYLGVHEVTQIEYEQVMGVNPSHFAPKGAGKEAVAGMKTTNHPVETVSWNDAAEFCAKLSEREKFGPYYSRTGESITALNGAGYRLPTEAEWECACRAGTATKYWIGDNDEDLVKAGWFGKNSAGRTHAAGELTANPFGLFDIHGNVWEWVQDGWDSSKYSQFEGKPAINPGSAFSAESLRVIRGGLWSLNASYCRTPNRRGNVPTARDQGIGFRAALGVREVKEAIQSGQPKPGIASTGWQGWPKSAPLAAIAPFDAAQASQHQAAWAKHLGVPVEYTNSIGMKFRLIPPGDFQMGSTAAEIEAALAAETRKEHWRQCIRSEAPQHKVILPQPLYLGVYEVTQAQYEKVAGKNPFHFAASGAGKEAVVGLDTSSYPAEMVSWNDAAEFCAKLSAQEQLKPFYSRIGETVTMLTGTGYRLPTEAEWEFSCRAGTTAKYWIGDKDDALLTAGWFSMNNGGRTHAAGELKSNPFGLYDIHGNVWEWVQDWWEPSFYSQFLATPALNPSGSSSGSQRVIRGGHWFPPVSNGRSSSRLAHGPLDSHDDIGFRVVLTVDAVKAAITAAPPRPAANAPSLNTALQFDGDDVVDIPGLSFDPQGSYTLEGFITSPAKADKGAGFVFGMPQQSYLSFTRMGDWRWVYAPKKRQSGREVAIFGAAARQARTHLACVRDGEAHRLFVDGKLFRKTAEVSSPAVGMSPFQIGSEFRGVIDEMRVSRVARYQADFSPPDRFAPDDDTLGLYHFDEATGDVLRDSSPHKHDGKITGATWVRADGLLISSAGDSNRP